MNATVKIKCTHMAAVEGARNECHQVIFDPDPDTVKAVFEWKDARDSRYIECHDRSGVHVSRTHERAIRVIFDYGTMVVTTL